jgi:hypothetical protein
MIPPSGGPYLYQAPGKKVYPLRFCPVNKQEDKFVFLCVLLHIYTFEETFSKSGVPVPGIKLIEQKFMDKYLDRMYAISHNPM